MDWPLSGTCGIGTGHARVSILFVARRESAWAGIILFPHGQTSYEIVVNQGQQFCGRAWPWPRFCAKTPAEEFLGHLDSISAARTNAVLARGRAQ